MIKNSKSWFHPVYSVLMALMMSGVMSFVNTAVHIGFAPDFPLRWMKSYGVGFVIAVPVIYLVAPVARKWAGRIVGLEE